MKFIIENPVLLDKLQSLKENFNKKINDYSKENNSLGNNYYSKTIDEGNSTNSHIEIKLKNLNMLIYALNESTLQVFNKLYLNVQFLFFEKLENRIFQGIDDNYNYNNLNISIYKFAIGFEFSKNYDYPIIQIPFSEIFIDEKKNEIKINIQNSKNIIYKFKSEKNIISNIELEFLTASQELDNFINEVTSITLFINFDYINTLHKIIESLFKNSIFLQNFILDSKEEKRNINDNKTNNTDYGEFNNEKNFPTPIKTIENDYDKNDNNYYNNHFKRNFMSNEKNNKPYENKNTEVVYIENPIISNYNIKNNQTDLKKTQLNKTSSDNLILINIIDDKQIINNNNIYNKEFKNIYQNKNSYALANKEISNELIKKEKNKNINSNQIKKNNISEFNLSFTIFDFKIIYLVDYKNDYSKIFRYNQDIINKRYFGYIFRFYQIFMSYETNENKDQLKLDTNLVTISFLNNKNFQDEKFFFYDKDIKYLKFRNLKKKSEFEKFHKIKDESKNIFSNDLYLSQFKNFLNYNIYFTNILNRNIYEITDIKDFRLFFELDNLQDKLHEQELSKFNSTDKKLNSNKSKNSDFENENNIYIYQDNKKIRNKKDDFYEELIFDHKHTLMKINQISFKRDKNVYQNAEDIFIFFNDLKITWNKFNMDVLEIILFKDVFQILDKIILKFAPLDNNKENNELNDTNSIFKKNEFENLNSTKNIPVMKKNNINELNLISSLDIGRFNFLFELNKPQICIQNEIKKSKVLLSTPDKFNMIISKICLNESKKDMKIDLNLNKINFFISPNYMDSKYIYWIGNSEENKYYLEENMFCEIFNTPNVNFVIDQNVIKKQPENSFDLFTKMSINIEEINANFNKKSFTHFQNIFEVFIFNRGYSYADEKINIDSRENDLKVYDNEYIRKGILSTVVPFISSNKNIQKEIEFNLKNVEITLNKEDKEIIKFLIKNFEGEHIIYNDNASETNINIKDLKIMDLCDINREIILCSNYQGNKINTDFEDKLDLITFRRKDSFISAKIRYSRYLNFIYCEFRYSRIPKYYFS